MLQLVMNTFWDAFLQPLVLRLGWKRVQKDCRDCYFQSSRCVWHVYHELIKILMESFAPTNLDSLRIEFEANNNQGPQDTTTRAVKEHVADVVARGEEVGRCKNVDGPGRLRRYAKEILEQP